jgi:hypothetical protein
LPVAPALGRGRVIDSAGFVVHDPTNCGLTCAGGRQQGCSIDGASCFCYDPAGVLTTTETEAAPVGACTASICTVANTLTSTIDSPSCTDSLLAVYPTWSTIKSTTCAEAFVYSHTSTLFKTDFQYAVR